MHKLIKLYNFLCSIRRRGQRNSPAKLDDAESTEMHKQGSPASPAARNTAKLDDVESIEMRKQGLPASPAARNPGQLIILSSLNIYC